jgi:hypothetical protein
MERAVPRIGKRSVFCSNCGQQIPATARYCPSCGSRVETGSDLSALPESIFASDPASEPASEQPTTFLLLSGNQLRISQTSLRIEGAAAVPLLDLPVAAISAMRRNGAEIVLTRFNGETVAITFMRMDDASHAEQLLATSGIRPEAFPDWAPQPVPSSSSSTMKSFGIGCAVLLGICMLLGIIGALANPGSDGVSSIDRSSNQSRPAATWAGSSNANISSTVYQSAVMSQADALSVSMGRFAVLAQDPQFFSGTWMVEVETELAIWQATYREALSMSTPSGYDAFHRKYVAALAKFDAAASKVTNGIDTNNPGLIEDASADMDEGIRLIDEAMDEFPG